jgi:hypothetical protein
MGEEGQQDAASSIMEDARKEAKAAGTQKRRGVFGCAD